MRGQNDGATMKTVIVSNLEEEEGEEVHGRLRAGSTVFNFRIRKPQILPQTKKLRTSNKSVSFRTMELNTKQRVESGFF